MKKVTLFDPQSDENQQRYRDTNRFPGGCLIGLIFTAILPPLGLLVAGRNIIEIIGSVLLVPALFFLLRIIVKKNRKPGPFAERKTWPRFGDEITVDTVPEYVIECVEQWVPELRIAAIFFRPRNGRKTGSEFTILGQAEGCLVKLEFELNDQSELREIELRVNRGDQWWSKSKGKIYAPKTAPKELRETANSLGKTLLGDFSLQSVRDLETSYGPLLVFRGGNSAWKFRTHLFQSGELYRMKMEARLQPEKLGHHSRGNPSIS